MKGRLNIFLGTFLLSKNHQNHSNGKSQESVAGSVIQATGAVEFQDGLWIENHPKAQNGLQRVYTIPGAQPQAVRTPRFLQEQTEFQSAWIFGCFVSSQVQVLIPSSLGVGIDLA